MLGALALVLSPLVRAPVGRSVEIDAQRKTTARSEMWRFSVGSDRARIFLRDDHQRDLLELQKQIGFRYLRCHGIFNQEMNVVRRQPDGSLAFDWSNVDRFIDRLRRARLRPFVECGFMPEPLASGQQTIFWWKGNVTPPKREQEWSQLIGEFARHEIRRRGLAEVRRWYFEVWNEPNLDGFWTGGQDGYLGLYASTARALKAADPLLRVGGPATAGMGWIPDLLGYVRAHGLPIDFVSSHSYSATEGFLDEKGKGGGTVLVTTPGTLVDEFTRARRDIRASAFPKIPLFITEWGPSYSPRDPVHDSYVCAAYILEKTRQCEGIVDGMSYWAFSDQFEEPGPPNRPFHGGFGLLNVDGLRKPAFYAYRFLARLHNAEIPVADPRTIATRQGDSLRTVVWDYSPPKQDAPNEPFYHRDLPAGPLPETVLRYRGLRPGRYALWRVGIGYGRNDVYDAYMRLGKPGGQGAHLPKETLDALRAAAAGRPESLADATVDSTGVLDLRLPMRTNDVWLVGLERKG